MRVWGLLKGISTILVIGAGVVVGLTVGLFFGILALLLGVWLVTLVAPSVQMWIDRSLVGHHSSQVLPFEDLASEQSSLEMVFQGLVVELSWEPVRPDSSEYTNPAISYVPASIDYDKLEKELERASNQVRINLKVRVPKLDVMELVFQLTPREKRRERIFDWVYQKSRSNEVLSLSSNSEYGMTQNSGPGNQPKFAFKDNAYEAEWSQVYLKSTLTQFVELTIDFKSIDTRSFSRDVLTIQIEDPESERETPE